MELRGLQDVKVWVRARGMRVRRAVRRVEDMVPFIRVVVGTVYSCCWWYRLRREGRVDGDARQNITNIVQKKGRRRLAPGKNVMSR